MIGNDIVDLNLAAVQSNWKRNRFLNKVFTEYEQEFIMTSEDPDAAVWFCWSMKESAYKVYVQQYQRRFFAPKKIKCQLTFKNKHGVLIENDEYNINSVFDNNFIYSTATLNSNEFISNNFFKISNDSYSAQHAECYKHLMLAISDEFDIPIRELQIKKNKVGVPEIYQNSKQLKISFSISHHGNYGVYSILNFTK